MHLKKFVRLFKFICLREIFFATRAVTKEPSAEPVSVSFDAKFATDDEVLPEESEEVASFFHPARKKSPDNIRRTVEDYMTG